MDGAFLDAAFLADVVVILHLCYAAFVVLGFPAIGIGGILRWGWVRNRPFRVIHLAAIAFVAVEAVAGIVCPLTGLEYYLRWQAGGAPQEGAFMARLASGLLYYDFPLWVFTAAYVALSLLALALLVAVPPRRKTRGD